MRAKTLTSYSPLTTNATRFASGVTLATAATLAQTTTGSSLAHLITVTQVSATNHSGKTITIVGTDADGKDLSEGIAGPNGAVAVTTTKHFKTVTSVTASATCGADTFNIGFNVAAVSPTIPIDSKQSPFNLGVSFDISGTINYTGQYTLNDPFSLTTNPAPGAAWVSMPSPFASATADQAGALTVPCTAIRFLINTVTNGATMQMSYNQPTVW